MNLEILSSAKARALVNQKEDELEQKTFKLKPRGTFTTKLAITGEDINFKVVTLPMGWQIPRAQ